MNDINLWIQKNIYLACSAVALAGGIAKTLFG
jgi:hypothetical protein